MVLESSGEKAVCTSLRKPLALAQPLSHQGDQGGKTSSALSLHQVPDFDSLGKKGLALEGSGCPGGRCRLQMAGDRPLLPTTQQLLPEHRDCHPRRCHPVSPALLPRPSGHIVLWGHIPHQAGVCAQGSQGLGVPWSPLSRPGSYLVRAAVHTVPRCPRPRGATVTAFPAVPSQGWRLSQPVSGYLT